jgi:hypothetical protein
MISFWALLNPVYANVTAVTSARNALVQQSYELMMQEWTLFRQVTENHNGIIGVGEDVGNGVYRDVLCHGGGLAP